MNKKIIAVIPARGGSKGISKKNIKLLNGKPLIAYPIELAKSIQEINRVIVSTDSTEIANVAKKYGAEVPFIRPSDLAKDETPTIPVLKHCVKFLENKENYKADLIVLLYPTSPLLRKEIVQKAIDIFNNGDYETIMSVEKDFGRYWKHDPKDNKHKILYPENRINRQYYQPLLKENGALCLFSYQHLINNESNIDHKNTYLLIMNPEENIDIDTIQDWKKAEEIIKNNLNIIPEKSAITEEKKMESEIKEIRIGSKLIGDNHPCFIIAELSANHNQDFELAVKTIKAAKEAGADAIKIQTYTADTITMDCDNKYFQIKQGGVWDGQTLYQLYQKAYTPWEWQPKLKQIAEELGLIFFSTPFDNTAVDFLEEMNVPAYKIASYEITDIPLIEYIASKGKPIFISTGTATLEEIQEAIDACKRKGNDQIVILKCVSGYPTPLEEVNLNIIPDFSKKFATIIGLSDHTIEMSVPIAAVALGAKVIERHLILDRNLGGPDSHFSTDINEFKQIVKSIREIEQAFGRATYELTDKMIKERTFRRSLFFVENIKEGETITEKHVRSIRPAAGLATKYINKVLGKNAIKDIKKGTPVSWELIE